SPWAIGAAEGGHKAVHPELGTLDDVRALVAAARERGIEVALDIAFQASPDHPYLRAHPEWFRRPPDGTMQYAENPPKKYQDIYPFDFESDDRPALCEELAITRRLPARAGLRILGVDAHAPQGRLACTRPTLRSVHTATRHVPPRQARLHTVLHLLRVALRQARAHRVRARPRPDGLPRI